MEDELGYYNEYDDEEKPERNNGSAAWGIILGIIIASLVWGIGKGGKYEGQTAENWFYEYDYCESRLQTYQECTEDAIPNIAYHCSP